MQTLSLDHVVTSICWNRVGSHFLTGGSNLILWEYAPPLPVLDPSPELQRVEEEEEGEGEEGEGEEGEGEGKGEEVEGLSDRKEEEGVEKKEVEGSEAEEGCLKEVWRCEVSSPVKHLKFSPNGDLFATCGDVSATPPPLLLIVPHPLTMPLPLQLGRLSCQDLVPLYGG